jgi:hypothetical protein
MARGADMRSLATAAAAVVVAVAAAVVVAVAVVVVAVEELVGLLLSVTISRSLLKPSTFLISRKGFCKTLMMAKQIPMILVVQYCIASSMILL